MARYRGGRSRSYEGDSQTTWWAVLLFLAALVTAVGIGWWILSHSKSHSLRTPLIVGAGFDVSQSVSKLQKQRGVAFLNNVMDTLLPARTPIKIWRYAETFEVVHQGQPITSRDLNKVSRETIENHMGAWGTRPDKVLQQFRLYLQEQPTRKAVLCLFTDGECHDPEATRAVAVQLAQDPRVVAVVIGPVINRYRASVEGDNYAPLREAGKLFVFGETDAQDTLSRLKEHLFALEN
ncbi:MAG: VWA domain-containing protein [Fimbriimonadales bacterium]|nr:VWA domain-containing protein [Fimbriimonadales bacterium]